MANKWHISSKSDNVHETVIHIFKMIPERKYHTKTSNTAIQRVKKLYNLA